MDFETSAIRRLQYGAEIAYSLFHAPLMIAYSGGKDSDVLLHLAQKANIDFEVKHNLTTVDAPPTIRHIQSVFARLDAQGILCQIEKPIYKKMPTTMWKLIVEKGIPPTRQIRYCCQVLKESRKENTVIATGVRWAESPRRRKQRGVIERQTYKRENNLILLNDNEESRRMFETCYRKGKSIVNPIVNWPNEVLLDYIQSEGISMNPLYAEGFSRIGCIGCPMAGKKREMAFTLFPSYQKAYIRAFDAMLEKRKADGKDVDGKWETGQDVFDWWMNG